VGGSNASKTSAAKRNQGGGGGSAAARGNANLAGSPVYPIESLSPYQNKCVPLSLPSSLPSLPSFPSFPSFCSNRRTDTTPLRRWTIKARVTTKSDIRTWQNAKGEGKLFSVNLLDESVRFLRFLPPLFSRSSSSVPERRGRWLLCEVEAMNLKLTTRFSLPFLNSQGEIRATGFNQAVDNLYETLQEGKVYLISKARVNIAKKQFTNLTNEYEIMFENSTEVQLVRPFFSPSSTPVADARS
jgi:replication factor A1